MRTGYCLAIWHQESRLLPFTRDQFISVFAAYNSAIWPAQILAYLLGVISVGLLARPGRASARLMTGALALSWLWTAIVYDPDGNKVVIHKRKSA